MPSRIIVTILDGLHYRYLVDTGILEEIILQDVDVLIITTRELKKKFSAANINMQKVKLSELVPVTLTRAQRLHMFLINNSNKKLSETLNVKNELKKKTRRLSYLASKVVNTFSSTFFLSTLLKVSGRSFASHHYRKLLSDFQPSLVVFSTPGQKPDDLSLLYETIQKGIKSISPVYSWDNLTAKGPFVFNVDRLIVWNNIMKDEAITYHRYKPEDVFVAGVPVFDRYAAIVNENIRERDHFFESLNLDKTLPLITIATIPVIYFGTCHFNLAEKILNFIGTDELPKSNILIRPHPLDGTDYTPLTKYNNVVVDYYGSSPDKNSLATWIPREDNISHLARTMKYSNIVINIASTITIDAACFNTPVINIAYDMKQNENDYVGSISRYYHYTHYSHVVKANAADLVRNDKELLDSLKKYLNDPAAKTSERKLLVEQQTGKLDGLAYKRVADAVINYLNA